MKKSKHKKAGIITAVSGALMLLMLWEADEKLNGSKGKAWFIRELRKTNPVDTDEVKAWLKRTPLYTERDHGDKDIETVVNEEVDAVVTDGLKQGLLRRIKRRGK